MWKLTSACPQEQLVALNFFKKFWTVLDFLQNSLAWFSNFYLRVQSKTCGRKSFLIFLFGISFGFWAKFFSDFWPKNFKKFSKLPSTCPEEQFVAWNFSLKFWTVLDFLQERLAWFSKFYLGVQSKNCRRISFFLFFFSEFFRILSDIFSDFWPKNFKRFQNYLLRVQRNNLCLQSFLKSFEPLLIFCRNLWHCSQNSIYVSRVKIAEETVFLFFFSEFFRILSKNFQTFGQKTSRNCHNYPLRVKRNNLWLEFFLSFESFRIFCRNLWQGSQNSIHVSRVKIAEKIVFFCFLFSFFDFWAKLFQTFVQKTSKNCENYLCVSTGTTCGFKFF